MNPLEVFLQEAMSHVGEDGSWTYRTSGLPNGMAWCAAFVCACAKIAGILDVIIHQSFSCSTLAQQSDLKKYGTFILGPWFGNTNFVPEPGDLIFYRWSSKSTYNGKSKYFADHIEIVRSSDNTIVATVGGNTRHNGQNSRVGLHNYSLKYSCISAYFRPNWSSVVTEDDIKNSGAGYGDLSSLYTTQSTKEDAAVRQICSVDQQGKPSITPTDVKLCTINYTSTLAAVLKYLGYQASPDQTDSIVIDGVDTTGLPSRNATIIADYLLSNNFSASQMVGILANIQAESWFKPNAVNTSSRASGICQWLGARKTKMMEFVGTGWQNNLTGQLDFLLYELNSYENKTLRALKLQITSDSEESARKAADIFVRQFERPGNIDKASLTRQNMASSLWKCLVFVKQKPDLSKATTWKEVHL